MNPFRASLVLVMAVAAVGCGGDGGEPESSSSAEYCTAVEDAGPELDALLDLDLDDESSEVWTDYIRGWAAVMSDLGRAAPGSLDSEFDAVNDVLDELDDALRNADAAEVFGGPDGPRLAGLLDTGDVAAAFETIDERTEERCDVRLGATRNIGLIDVYTAQFVTAAGDPVAVPESAPPPTVAEATPPTAPPTVAETVPPPPPSTTRPVVLPTNPPQTVPPTPVTLVPEPTQAEAQALATAIHDTWPTLSEEEATCISTEILHTFTFDAVILLLEAGDPAVDEAADQGAVNCGVDPAIFA